MATMLIVDDHPVVRLAVRLLLEKAGHSVLGETGDGVETLGMVRALKPDVVLLDLDIPKLGGLEVIARLQAFSVVPKILVLSSQNPGFFSGRCMRAGAQGFVYKQERTDELMAGVKAVMSGYSFFPSQTLEPLQYSSVPCSEMQLLESLSDRELNVLRYLALGYTNIQIAGELLINNKTVSSYKKRLQEKLGELGVVGLSELAKRHALV